MSKELALVIQKVAETGESVKSLEELISQIPTMSTEVLVTGFSNVNSYSKRIDKFADAIKKELVDNKTQRGRFIAEGEVDVEGHRYLKGIDGEEIQAQKRVSAKLDPKLAEEYLKEKGLYEQAIDVSIGCTDANKVYDIAMKMLNGELTEEDVKQLGLGLLEVLSQQETLSEDKIKALVTLGSIDVDDVEDMMETKIIYAVMSPKK